MQLAYKQDRAHINARCIMSQSPEALLASLLECLCWQIPASFSTAQMALVGIKTVCACVQATPANWPYNHDSIGKKGWAFLLPTVTPEDAKLHFPDHHSCQVCTHYTCTDRCTCKKFWWSTCM